MLTPGSLRLTSDLLRFLDGATGRQTDVICALAPLFFLSVAGLVQNDSGTALPVSLIEAVGIINYVNLFLGRHRRFDGAGRQTKKV